MKNPYMASGESVNRLTLIDDAWLAKDIAKFNCSCGRQYSTVVGRVKRGTTKSCGCINRERLIAQNKSWSLPNPKERRYTYRSWESMIARCLNTEHMYYYRYGGRGIYVDDSWLSFDNFLMDMGYRPEGKELNRINNDLGYYKENCNWVEHRDNMRNTSVNNVLGAFGEEKSIADWAEDSRCETNTVNLYKRIQEGWDHEEAISTPTSKTFRPRPSFTNAKG